jgi:hypothetical protein
MNSKMRPVTIEIGNRPGCHLWRRLAYLIDAAVDRDDGNRTWTKCRLANAYNWAVFDNMISEIQRPRVKPGQVVATEQSL